MTVGSGAEKAVIPHSALPPAQSTRALGAANPCTCLSPLPLRIRALPLRPRLPCFNRMKKLRRRECLGQTSELMQESNDGRHCGDKQYKSAQSCTQELKNSV